MTSTRLLDLPRATEHTDEIARRVEGRVPAVFLDYDGTLTPIVARPEDATLPEETQAAVERLRDNCPVAVVSGRDLADVRKMVGIEGIFYAGSHGFDIAGPRGESEQHGREFLPALDAAETELRGTLGAVAGARLERKAFAVAVHYREVADDDVPAVEDAVEAVAARHPDLKVTGGKKIFELRPGIEWDKGRALLRLLETLGLDRDDVLPLYLGDDVTDEDAFRAIRDRGIGLVVQGEDDERPSAAHYRLADTGEVRLFLDQLASSLGEAAP